MLLFGILFTGCSVVCYVEKTRIEERGNLIRFNTGWCIRIDFCCKDKPIYHHLNATMTALKTRTALTLLLAPDKDGYLMPNLECLIGHGADVFQSVKTSCISRQWSERKFLHFNTVLYLSCAAGNIKVEDEGKGYKLDAWIKYTGNHME